MAKNKITIDIEVNGKMQKATVSAKKLRDALDQTSKSARTTDRNMKGASQQSANATKNFSKMAQGMTGTLVPAYATLAANVFAISAAFNFLKSAGDLKALEEGQIAYAAGTGIAIKNLTNDIVEATNAQISFQDAAQASAIGLASGLSQKQLKSLGTAAKDVSLVLGRDVTDSFNRLIRGVTKAEPELLDELGIILRLETATENYAVALGKNAKDLTQFEKSQAIANEVLTQTEQKYSSMLTSQDKLANSFAQLGKSFENQFLKPLKIGIADVLTPIVDFLSENLTALAAVLTLVALPITRAIIPSLDDWASSSVKAAAKASKAYKQSQKDIQNLRVAQQQLKMSQADPNVAAQGALAGIKSRSTGVQKFQKGDFGSLSKKEINGLLRAAENGKGAVTQMSEQMKAQYIAALRAIKTESKTTFGTVKMQMKSVGQSWKIMTTGMVLQWQKVTVKMKLLAAKAAKGIDFAFKAMGWIGWILLGIDLITMAYDALVGMFESEESKQRRIFAEQEEERIQGITESLKALNEELQSINDRSQQKTGLAGGTFFSNFIGNVDLVQLREGLKTGSTAALDTIKQISVAANKSGIAALGTAASSVASRAPNVKNLEGQAQEDEISNLMQILSLMAEKANVAKELEQSLKNQAEAQAKFLADLTPRTQYDNMIAQYEQTLSIAKKNIVDMSDEELKQYNQGEQLLKSMRDLRRQELGMVNDSMQAEINRTEALRNASKQSAAVMQAKAGEEKIEDEITKLKSRQLLHQRGELTLSDDQIEAERLRLLLLDQQLLTAQEKTRLLEIEVGLLDRIRANELAMATNRVGRATQKGQLGVFAAATGRQLDVDESRARGVNLALERSRLEEQQEGLDPEGDKFKELQQRIDLQDKAIEAEQKHLDLAKKNLTDVGRIGLGVGQALNDSMQTAFQGVIEGTMSMKEAFASMATSVLQMIAKIITELLVAKMLQAALGGTSFGDFLGIPGPGKRYGGVMGANGKEAPGYAVGGVAKGPQSGYPVTLHGTEAIVPLPNGKSIPVEMKGHGQQNNVTVNVAMDNSGQTSSTTEGDSGGMDIGKAIAGAVQKELQNQKRAGGMLSPYGVA